MPGYQDHINRTISNLTFLEKVNASHSDYFDWEVTICFYSALHLVNAHLAKFNLQYRKHKDVKDILNPFTLSPAKLPQDEYSAYVALQSLSRRARYLVNERDNNLGSNQAYFTYDKHFGKALRHLNLLMDYFDDKYTLGLPTLKIACSEIKYYDTKFITKP